MRLIDSEMSMPGTAWMARVKRRASAPYSRMMSSGSTTLFLVLLIFWPFSSRIRPLISTSRKGTALPKWMPIMIMRATQKKMMSKPVAMIEVG